MMWAALAAIDSASSPTELVEQLETDGAVVSRDRAEQLLDDLAARGLVRVAQALEGAERRAVRTDLGDELVRASVAGGGLLDQRLSELERLRGDLLSTVAHELRTPLTSIRTSVGLLLDPDTRATAAQRRELLASIERSAERMQQHADDVLDLARFRTGHIRLGLRRFDARAVPREVAETLASTLEVRRQRIAIDAPEEPVWIVADHRRVERALLNIASNAQKFSSEGASIGIRVAAPDSEVSWEVTDSGPGIADEERGQLFERFFVGATDGGRPGAGLGLPIALAIAQAHGGRIEVDSVVGRGSTFRLILPAAGPEASAS